jgi:hypothetical protein
VQPLIHYHGTPITPREQLLRMAGRHFCVSYAADQDLKTCLRIGQSVMFDNGAFSAWTRGLPLDVPGYYRWLEPVLAHPHFAIIPDVIDGTVEQNAALIDAWPFADWLGAPVWHLNEPLDVLTRFVEAGWPRVCIGSAGQYRNINTPEWCSRMDETFNELVRMFGTVPWIHGLRMLGQTDRWPLASADSTNVAQNWKRDTGCAECKAAPIDATQPPAVWTLQPIQQALT